MKKNITLLPVLLALMLSACGSAPRVAVAVTPSAAPTSSVSVQGRFILVEFFSGL